MNSVLVTKVFAGKGSGSSADTKKPCDFYSRREFGPLFLAQIYQRCVHNRNAMYVILLWQNFGILFYPWTVEQDLWLFISWYLYISKKGEETQLFYTAPSPAVKKCSLYSTCTITPLSSKHDFHPWKSWWSWSQRKVHKDSFIVWELMQMLNMNETQSDYQKIKPVWWSHKLCYSIKNSHLAYIFLSFKRHRYLSLCML